MLVGGQTEELVVGVAGSKAAEVCISLKKLGVLCDVGAVFKGRGDVGALVSRG